MTAVKRSRSEGEDEKATVQIGIIGMGDMGRLYATKLAEGGWKQYVCSVR